MCNIVIVQLGYDVSNCDVVNYIYVSENLWIVVDRVLN